MTLKQTADHFKHHLARYGFVFEIGWDNEGYDPYYDYGFVFKKGADKLRILVGPTVTFIYRGQVEDFKGITDAMGWLDEQI